ncbi:MAG: elongation factor 1-beta [Candidatus Thorarchaeota archaeon]
MARVIMTIRIMPEDIDVDLDKLREKVKKCLPQGTDLRATEIVPVAFGLKALRVNLARDEALGGTDDIEAAITAIDGVAQVDVEMISRI